jgi:formate dehydrogenase maturation protein FdhE
MEPLAALGIASNIIQIVNFASRLVSRGHELYQSADGRLADHAVLDSAAQNLSTLANDQLKFGGAISREPTATYAQLVKLKADSQTIADKLSSALNKASVRGKHKKWQSIFQALMSIYKEKEISSLASQLDNIRKQVDTTLLVSLLCVRVLP